MQFNIIPVGHDDAPVTCEVMDEAWPWADVQEWAKSALERYPEAVAVRVVDRNGNELWRYPEVGNA